MNLHTIGNICTKYILTNSVGSLICHYGRRVAAFCFFSLSIQRVLCPPRCTKTSFPGEKPPAVGQKTRARPVGLGGVRGRRGDVWPVKGIRSPPLAGAETLLCFLACLTYFLRPDKLQRHEARLYVFGLGYIPERAEWTLGGREDRPVVGGQVVCPRRHTLLKGQAPRSGWFGLAALNI